MGIGDKVGHVDKDIVARLAFPDGTLAQPDHPPYPVAATLQSEVMAFYTTTSIGDLRWTFLALFNLDSRERGYRLDLEPFLVQGEGAVYDYFAEQMIPEHYLAGNLDGGNARYLVIPPRVGGWYLLGFLDKYITLSGRQVKKIVASEEGLELTLELPVGRSYTFTVGGADISSVEWEGRGISDLTINHRLGLSDIHFRVVSPECSLLLKVSPGSSG